MSDYEKLKAEAEELGIEVDGRWKEGRLQEEIDKVLGGDSEPEAPESEPEPEAGPEAESAGAVYKNISRCVQSICGNRVKPGLTYILSDQEQADERNMARLDRAVKFGFFEKV